MTIGLPKALLYYRYGRLWETFFKELDLDIVTSGDTNGDILESGRRDCIDENCLPLKIYMGHVRSLLDRCDFIFMPRICNFGRNEEMCVRFFGLYDLARCLYGDKKLLSYNLDVRRRETEALGFLKIGCALGKSPAKTWRAYKRAKQSQRIFGEALISKQNRLLYENRLKIMVAAPPYLIHDSFAGGPVAQMILRYGCVPVYSDRCDRHMCRLSSKELSKDIYWSMNKETIGAVALYRKRVDGVILLTAFPCGSDALVNELILRRVRDVPIIQILIDEQSGEAGLETRIESFVDILRERSRVCEK